MNHIFGKTHPIQSVSTQNKITLMLQQHPVQHDLPKFRIKLTQTTEQEWRASEKQTKSLQRKQTPQGS